MKKLGKIISLCLAVAILLFCVSCSSEKRKQQKVIGTCAGYEVLYEELRYVTLQYKDMLESTYGDGIWDNPETAEQYRAELEAAVWSNMLNNYAVLAACGAHGITEEDFENEAIVAAVDQQIEEVVKAYGGEDGFEKALDEMYMSEHFMRFYLTVAQLENELLHVLTEDLRMIEHDIGAFMDWLEEGNCVYVQHVKISNDEGDDIEANRAAAEEVRQKLLSGTEIGSIINSAINEDLQNTQPYYIVREVYTPEMEAAAFALTEVGDVSEVVETESAFYVLLRMVEDETTLLSKVDSLLTSYQWAKTEAYIETYKTNLQIELNDYGKSIDLLEIR